MALRKRVSIKEDGNGPDSPSESYTKVEKNVHCEADEDDLVEKDEKSKPQETMMVLVTPKARLVDRFLQGYAHYTSSAFNQDVGLKVLQYSLWMIGRFYFSKHSVEQQSLQALSFDVSWTRYVNRIFGWPAAIEAARSGSWGKGLWGRAMAWAMIGYYPLDHLAFVKWKAPNLIKFKVPGVEEKRLACKASAWSCRFWFLYILFDLLRSTDKLQDLKQQESTKEGDSQHFQDWNKAQRYERLQILRNVLFTLPCLHFSLPNWDMEPWLSDDLVNTLLWLESIVCLYQGVQNYRT